MCYWEETSSASGSTQLNATTSKLAVPSIIKSVFLVYFWHSSFAIRKALVNSSGSALITTLSDVADWIDVAIPQPLIKLNKHKMTNKFLFRVFMFLVANLFKY